MKCLVVVSDLEQGVYYDFRNVHNGARALPIPDNTDSEGLVPMRDVPVWVCEEGDVPALVEEVTRINVGIQVSVFKLFSTHTRLPGELKSLTVTKDGELPF